ncbi:ABC transporter substrate-binding protein [Pseudocolwellia sp. AS88]|jgi:phospholipid transport system substrate-binding protein|uniref:ABC transporter substrate-binding protein n=1 Tax=Pseudocolwellia TaxID=2848177 RepID=UPI0026EF4B8E|nr:ABC transporter substrate-binding protein [Pseudocolwellia sp. AS88]MDO7086156.1 ABC transporter substrate-binding protein [Pseudocolwellia sp. AS88]
MIKKFLTVLPLFIATSALANDVNTSAIQSVTIFNQPEASERVDKKNPYLMIRKVAEKTFKRFSNEQSAIQENPNLLKNIVNEELMPYIDYKYSAYKVIGAQNFKSTTEKERKAFVPVFRDYLITSYAQVFTLYKQQEVTFEPAKTLKNEKIVSVNTSVIEPGREPINISFRVRKNKKTNDWKAYDMVAEGVSLLDSKQAELSSIIRQKGLPHVTEMLIEKSSKDIVFKDGIN